MEYLNLCVQILVSNTITLNAFAVDAIQGTQDKRSALNVERKMIEQSSFIKNNGIND